MNRIKHENATYRFIPLDTPRWAGDWGFPALSKLTSDSVRLDVTSDMSSALQEAKKKRQQQFKGGLNQHWLMNAVAESAGSWRLERAASASVRCGNKTHRRTYKALHVSYRSHECSGDALKTKRVCRVLGRNRRSCFRFLDLLQSSVVSKERL